jgi:hypothetical protein
MNNQVIHTSEGIVNWQGEGWYADRQEGAHEEQRIVSYYVGSNHEEMPDTYEQCLGTPYWLDEKDLSTAKADNLYSIGCILAARATKLDKQGKDEKADRVMARGQGFRSMAAAENVRVFGHRGKY